MMATILVTLVVFLTFCGALTLGQWFGRPPIEGRCHPSEGGCGLPSCCRLDREKTERQ